MKRHILVALALVLSLTAGGAFAACPIASLTFKDAAGATQTICFDGSSGQFVPQYAPTTASTTQTGSSVAAQNVFQSVLAASTSRHGATVQNTSTNDTLLVFFGPIGSASTAAAFQLSPNNGPGSSISAVTGSGVVLSDQISVTCADATPANCTYVVSSQ